MAKFEKSVHFCNNWYVPKREGKVWRCRYCGAVYTCILRKGKLSWVQTRDGSK